MSTWNIPVDVRAALDLQRRSIDLLEKHLDADFERSVAALCTATNIVTTGVGKSGFVARKLAASLTSLGLPATFVHSVDALHGDLGAVSPGSVIVMFSKSGETRELLHLHEVLPSEKVTCICVTARKNSTLSARSHCTVLAPIEREFDRTNILPTASTTAAMIVADLLVMSIAHIRPDSIAVLSRTHPNGTIGSLLSGFVSDYMHSGSSLPYVAKGAPLETAIHILDQHALGIVCVTLDNGHLCGVLTDGDVRRIVERGASIAALRVDDVMTPHPATISISATLYDALQIMEARERPIGVLPVIDDKVASLVGVIRLHDVVRAQMAV